jgi:hypothetical protein
LSYALPVRRLRMIQIRIRGMDQQLLFGKRRGQPDWSHGVFLFGVQFLQSCRSNGDGLCSDTGPQVIPPCGTTVSLDSCLFFE